MVAGDLPMRRGRNPSVNIDQTTEPSCVGFDGRSVQPPGAVVDVRFVCGDGWFLDQENIQVLALVVIDRRLHTRPRFHNVQL